jgi:CubicO group peptidase (beta-lactamase class C family)
MRKLSILAVALLSGASSLSGLSGVTGQQSERTDAAALAHRLDVVIPRFLEVTGTPSVSVAVLRDGVSLVKRAWGLAQVESRRPATSEMRYAIGSVTKQFSAAAMLLLQQDGKLSLDDRVARHLPDVPHAGQVTIRQLLNHTAGYDDYWPQTYLPDYLLKPAEVPRIIREWGGRPLTFSPGAEFRYSNTNYLIAGAIVEKVSGVSFFRFLQDRIFQPLGMRSPFDYTTDKLPATDASGYFTYGIGPLRPATREAGAWLFGAGNLAMTAADLAVWDQSLISRALLSDASYREQQTETRLPDGAGTQVGLGVNLAPVLKRRSVFHLGGGSGFSSANYVFPDDRVAIVVLSNGESRTPWALANFIIRAVFAPTSLPETPEEVPRARPPAANTAAANRPDVRRAREMFERLRRGELDRSILTENGNAYFSKQAVADFASSLGPLGPPPYFYPEFEIKRGDMIRRGFIAWFPDRLLHITTMETPDGRLEQFHVAAAPPQWR